MHTQEVGTHLNRYLPRAEISIIRWTLESWASHTVRAPVPKALTWEFSCVTGALAASTPPRLLAGNVAAILLVPTEDSFNWTTFIMCLSTVTAKACAFQKAHTSRGRLLFLIMLVVTTTPEAANRGEMCGHSPSCQWECSQLSPIAALYSLFQEV